MLDRWIRAQRIALAAYWLNLSPTKDDAAIINRSLPLVSEFLEQQIGSLQRDRKSVTGLPVGVLTLLSRIPRGIVHDTDLEILQPEWKAIRDQKLGLTTKSKTGVPEFIGARILAYHILQGTGRPLSIFRLAKTVFGSKWQERENNAELFETLEQSLETLRSPWKSTRDKVDAVDSLGRTINSPAWIDVEHLLFHQLFCWPLLVFSNSALSLPVGVDVDFDDEQQTILQGDGTIVTSGWEPYLRRASEVARKMWRAKHGNYGSLREKVERVTVVYDFHWGDRIVSAFPERFGLKDSSMQPYFSQIALSRLLGNTVSVSRVVTGGIGEERIGEFGNYEFEWPQGVIKKLEYAFETKSFQRIILPNLMDRSRETQQSKELSRFLYRYRREQTTEINFVATLQNVADSFQVGGWRQHKYVRCPEIAWQVHPSGQRLPAFETPSVQHCLKELLGNEDTVLDLTGRARPADLAAALWQINVQLRGKLHETPPMISWAFVRVVPEEQDERFWEIVWQVTGASQKDFDDFLRTYTPEAAANQLTQILNRFSPNERSRSHRAPDVLVLIGTDHLSASLASMGSPLVRHYAFDPILEHLRQPGMMNPVPDPAMRRLLGKTRIVLFRTDEFDENDVEVRDPDSAPISEAIIGSLSRLELTPAEDEQLNQLTVFRFGFTQQMASLLWDNLGIQGLQVRYLLKRFTKKDLLRYGHGEYHIPREVREYLPPPDSPVAQAERHYAAAISLAPYLSETSLPGLAFDEALTPVHVHEANYHLSLALKSVPKGKREPLRARIDLAYSRLLRFAEHRSWPVVNRSLKLHYCGKDFARDVHHLAHELLREAQNGSDAPVHPQHFLTAARASEKWWQELRREVTEKGPIVDLGREIDQLFLQAEKACHHDTMKSERDYNLLHVLSSRAIFLHKNRPVLEHCDVDTQFSAISKKVLDLLKNGVRDEGALSPWYEAAGDNTENNREAAAIYRLGFTSVPTWEKLWLKAIGSTCLSFADRRIAEQMCDEMPVELFERAAYLKRSIHSDSAVCKPWVKARWTSAINLILRRHEADPQIREHLESCLNALRKWKT